MPSERWIYDTIEGFWPLITFAALAFRKKGIDKAFSYTDKKVHKMVTERKDRILYKMPLEDYESYIRRRLMQPAAYDARLYENAVQARITPIPITYKSARA